MFEEGGTIEQTKKILFIYLFFCLLSYHYAPETLGKQKQANKQKTIKQNTGLLEKAVSSIHKFRI